MIRTQSLSTGSLFDISGDKIVYEDIVIDYLNGFLIDITEEWGYNNAEIK